MKSLIWLSVILTVALGACVGSVLPTAELSVHQLPLSPEDPSLRHLGKTEVLGILELKSSDIRFGGLSGMVIENGNVTTISDAGNWVRFHLMLDTSGRPMAVTDLEIGPLGGLDGSKWNGDAEEIVLTRDGPLVSFERHHRLWLYPDGLSGMPVPVATPFDFSDQPENGGVEALTQLPDGRLLALSENGGAVESGTAWLRSETWKHLTYFREAAYHPTAVSVLPGGDLLVLERTFSLFGGFGMRLVRVPGADVRPNMVLKGIELARLNAPLTVDNFEGLAVQTRADGRLIAYLISDNNFNSLQSTLLMTLLLPL